MAKLGDKYMVEIGEVIETEDGNLYRIKGFNSLVFDQNGLNKLEKAQEPTGEVPEIIKGFAELARLLSEGAEIHAGQKVDCETPDGQKTEWVVIETRPEVFGEGKAIVAQRTVNRYDAFSYVSKDHPWGYNDYAVSKARDILKREYPEGMKAEDLAVVEPRHLKEIGAEKDLFWLLHEDEVDGENAYEWFQDEEHRQMTDWEGDECYWFLRGPYPSYAYYVRSVFTDGSLDSYGANYAIGFVAACIICYQDILPA